MSGAVRRAARVLCLLLLAGIMLPAVARADGDPASDVLLGQNVFYPYDPPVPIAVQHRLNAVANQAHSARLPIKVALIGGRQDLGVIPSLFGKPQRYAEYLEREISFQGPQPLLVVMHDGYGVEGFNAPARSAAASLAHPAGPVGHDSIALARAAMKAIPILAKADGHPLRGQARSASTSNGGGGSNQELLLLVLILAAVIVAALLLLARVRQSVGAR